MELTGVCYSVIDDRGEKARQKLKARLKKSQTPDLQHRNPVPY
jgi:hypothetical protein